MFLRISRQLVAESSMIKWPSRSLTTVADMRAQKFDNLDPTKLRVDFLLTPSSKLVDRLIVPTKRGQKSIFPGQKDTYAALKPGLLSLVSGNETTKYFISSGSLFIHGGQRASLRTTSIIPLDHIDVAAIKTALAEYNQKDLAEFTQKLTTVLTSLGKAEALNAALTSC